MAFHLSCIVEATPCFCPQVNIYENLDTSSHQRELFIPYLSHVCYILYPIVQRNCWFANSDVPFQSVTNDLLHGQFAMQTYALHQVDVTSELLHSWWLAHAQSNNKTINVFGLVFST